MPPNSPVQFEPNHSSDSSQATDNKPQINLNPPTTPPPPVNNSKPPKKKSRIILIIGLFILIVCIGLAGFVLLRSKIARDTVSAPKSDNSSTSKPSSQTIPAGYELFERPCFSFAVKSFNGSAYTKDDISCQVSQQIFGEYIGDFFTIQPYLNKPTKNLDELTNEIEQDIVPSLNYKVASKTDVQLDGVSSKEIKLTSQNPDQDAVMLVIYYDKPLTFDLDITSQGFYVLMSYFDDYTKAAYQVLKETWQWR